MKLEKPNVWTVIFGVYFVFLAGIIWIYNPDFTYYRNSLLLIPLYIPVFVEFYIKRKNREEGSYVFDRKLKLLIVTALVAALVTLSNYLR